MHARGHNQGDSVWVVVQAVDFQPDSALSWEDTVLAPLLAQTLADIRQINGVEYVWLGSDPTRIECRMASRKQAKQRVGEIADAVRRQLAVAGL